MTTPAPSVPGFIAGYGPQQSDWQSLWVNALAFFQQRVVFRATQTTTATSLPASGAVTKIAYDNVIEDPYGGWNASTHEWLAPLGLSGWYQVTVTVWAVAPGVSEVILQSYVQGTGAASNLAQGIGLSSVAMSSALGGGAECTWYPYLVGGHDYVYGAGAIQNSSGAILTDLTAGQNSSIEVIFIST